jgi:hypothetical protein
VRGRRFYSRGALSGVFRSEVLSHASVFAASLGLLLQILIPAVHLARVQFGGGIGAAGFTAICHGDRAPADAADRGPEPGKNAPVGVPAGCPICLGAQTAGTILQPPPITALPPLPVRAVSFTQCDRAALASPYRTPTQPRAPPATV